MIYSESSKKTVFAEQMPKTYKFQIQLSEFDMRWLTYWANLHGRPKGTFASQIIGARIEANIELIRSMMSNHARHENISTDELEELWFNEDKDKEE